MKILKEDPSLEILELDPISSSVYDIRKQSEGEALIQCTLVPYDYKLEFEELRDLSKETGSTVYFVPENIVLTFNHDGFLKKVEGNESNLLWQFIDGWPMPYPCFLNGFPFWFDMKALWESDIPVETLPVEELDWMLDFSWWESEKGDMYKLKPRRVLQKMDDYPRHREKIESVDTSYPLIVTRTQQDRWLVIDGVHRFVKLMLGGAQDCNVKKFDIESMKGFIKKKDFNRHERWVRGLIG